jgi:DNA polymerase-3 subunit gamma/tau
MVLVRIAYAADLPSPDEVIRALSDRDSSEAAPRPGNGGAAALTSAPSPRAAMSGSAPARTAAAPAREPMARLADPAPAAPPSAGAPAPLAVARFEDLIALANEKRDLVVRTALERDVRLVRFEDGKLEVALEAGAAATLVGELARKLSQWTGRRWMVAVSAEQGAPTVKAQADARKAELMQGVTADPLVQAVLNRFPGAQIVGVRAPASAATPMDMTGTDETFGAMGDDESAFGARDPEIDGDDAGEPAL